MDDNYGFIDIKKIDFEMPKDEDGTVIDWTRIKIDLLSAELGSIRDAENFILVFQIFMKEYNLKHHPKVANSVFAEGKNKRLYEWGNPGLRS